MVDTIQKYIKDKSVLILGFGREGKSTLSLIQKVGGYTELAISDLNEVSVDDENIRLHCGKDYQKVLNEYDVIFKSPGIVLEMERNEITGMLLSQTQVFFERYGKQIVGITGTKGKSTTTTLLYNILKEAGKSVVLAGNIGIPAFDIWENIEEDTIITFEMSSHQLEYMTVAPHIAVYLNVHEEHLDHYGTMEKYVKAKENIYRYQQKNDILFVNEQIVPHEENYEGDSIAVGYDVSSDIIILDNMVTYKNECYEIPVDDIRLMGEHNYYNIAVCYGIATELGISEKDFTKGLCTYETLPHRLQYVGTFDGIKFYDDSISTICDTAIQALNSVKDASTILIGGMDRGIEYDELIMFLSRSSIENIVLMYDTGKRIFNEIKEKYPDFKKADRIHLVDTLEEAVKLSKKITPSGRSCILSPAAASYGIFKNFEERGDVFQSLVRS